jgi:hypothetical protein
MKNLKLILLSLVSILALTTSCSFEKRLYRGGFYIDRNPVTRFVELKENSSEIEKFPDFSIDINDPANDENVSASTRADEDICTSTIRKEMQHIRYASPITVGNSNIIALDVKELSSKKNLKKILVKPAGYGFSGLAFAGFILSLLGFVLLMLTGFPFLLGTLGVIFSAVGLGDTGAGGRSGKAFAIAGLIIGIVTIILFWLLVVAFAAGALTLL